MCNLRLQSCHIWSKQLKSFNNHCNGLIMTNRFTALLDSYFQCGCGHSPSRWKRHSKIRVMMHVPVSECVRVCVSYLPPLKPISLSRDVTDGNVMVLFSTHAISLGIMASLFFYVIALIWKAIALESKSNQTRSHSDENELIRKAMCLLKEKKIKMERGHHAAAPSCFQMSLQLIYTQL